MASQSDDLDEMPFVVNLRTAMVPTLGRQRTAMLLDDDACCEAAAQAAHGNGSNRQSRRHRLRNWVASTLRVA